MDEPNRFGVYDPVVERTATNLRRRGFVVAADAFEVHRRLRAVLSARGFVVWKVERIPHHPIFVVDMFRGVARNADTRAGIARHVRKAIQFLTPDWRPGEISIYKSGDRISASFEFRGGLRGTLYIRPADRNRVQRAVRNGPPASHDRFRR